MEDVKPGQTLGWKCHPTVRGRGVLGPWRPRGQGRGSTYSVVVVSSSVMWLECSRPSRFWNPKQTNKYASIRSGRTDQRSPVADRELQRWSGPGDHLRGHGRTKCRAEHPSHGGVPLLVAGSCPQPTPAGSPHCSESWQLRGSQEEPSSQPPIPGSASCTWERQGH